MDLWYQHPRISEAVVRSLELSGMQGREDKTTRLRISVKPLAADKIQFRIMDLGFGEIVKGSEKVWEYTIAV